MQDTPHNVQPTDRADTPRCHPQEEPTVSLRISPKQITTKRFCVDPTKPVATPPFPGPPRAATGGPRSGAGSLLAGRVTAQPRRRSANDQRRVDPSRKPTHFSGSRLPAPLCGGFAPGACPGPSSRPAPPSPGTPGSAPSCKRRHRPTVHDLS